MRPVGVRVSENPNPINASRRNSGMAAWKAGVNPAEAACSRKIRTWIWQTPVTKARNSTTDARIRSSASRNARRGYRAASAEATGASET